MRRVFLFAAAVVVVAAAPSWALAQYQGGVYQGRSDNPNGPTVSPYLNLLGGNQLNGIPNYQSLVRPMIDQQNAIQRQGAGLQRLQQQVGSQGGPPGRSTGHATYFMNYSHFYPAPRPR